MITQSLLIVSIVLLIILVVPILCDKVHVPAIVGLIVAGVVVGPNGLEWIARDETLTTLGSLGLLYLMFTSGIEISLNDLRREKYKSFLFGLYTFTLPFLMGFAVAFYAFDYSMASALLLGSMLGSHTLITYPVVSRYNIQRNRVVSLIIGGTIVSVTAAMIFLAVIPSFTEGSVSPRVLVRMGAGTALMLAVLFYAMPKMAEWTFKRFNDSIVEFTFVMLMAALAGVMAWLAGLEPVLGVFLAGLALNRQIPNLSPLMNKINFMGNAFFIPVFLFGVGLLIDLRAFTSGWTATALAAAITGAALLGKWAAAWLGQKTFRLSGLERQLAFGLSSAKAAGSLAAVTIAYNVIMPGGGRLLDENVMNATVIMILITCTVSSFFTEHAAKSIALKAEDASGAVEPAERRNFLLFLPEPQFRLFHFPFSTFNAHKSVGFHALAVIHGEHQRTAAERQMELLARQAAASEQRVNMHTQLAANVSNGILNIANAEQITHIFAEFPTDEEAYGKAINPLLTTAGQGIWLTHSVQPLKTITSVRILAPDFSQKEPGYNDWRTLVALLVQQNKAEVTQENVSDWSVLPRIAERAPENQLIVIVQARPSTVSYQPAMQHTPEVLRRHFMDKNFLVIFPYQQLGIQPNNTFFSVFNRHNESNFALLQRLQSRHSHS